MPPAIKIEIEDDDGLGHEPIQMRKLFVGGLLPKTNEASLKAYFQKWGQIEDLIIIRDRFTRISRLFGFITYTHTYMVDNVQKARPHIVDGHIVQTKRAIPRHLLRMSNANASIKRLYVANLHDVHDENCLRKYFKSYGKVLNVEFPIDRETGLRRNFAFIDFDDYDIVDKILLRRYHILKNIALGVRKAYSMETRPRSNWCDCCKQSCSNNIHGGPRLNNQYSNFTFPNNNVVNSGYSWNNQNNSWRNQGSNFNLPFLFNNNNSLGNGYQQNFGGGPQRNDVFNNYRIGPF